MKNIDYIENKIELEETYIVKVKDYIKKMFSSKNQSKNILPYNIHVNDVFNMLKDVVTNENYDDYLVFFNYEFVLCLIELGVTPNRITYIANHNDSYLLTRDGMAGRSGMRTILFDKTIYKKYSYRKQWKEYIMNKLNGKKDFIVVGNIPFTMNETDSTNSKKIGNDFIKLINSLAKKACYILPAKFDSKTFINELILNKSLNKIVYHKKAIFDIHDGIKTCHILLDDNKKSDTFVYTDNISLDKIKLKKSNNLVLSKDVFDSYEVDTSVMSLGDLWTRGNKSLNKLKGNGQYKVITNLGSYSIDSFESTYDDEETTGRGMWKVIIPNMGGGRAVKIASPEYSLSYSVIGFCVSSKIKAKKLHEFFIENKIMEKITKVATSGANTKTLFSKITLPDGII
jgi:hypothetical protein